ncbi:MAG: 3'-5' exonuclease [Actinomycetota bacterium]|nr:3'-5' exonuclease [Actinomycetota bacterium]
MVPIGDHEAGTTEARTQGSPRALARGFAVVDVETTGFSPTRDRIVEVGVVVLGVTGVTEEVFATLVDPGRDPGPTHVHGISAAMVSGAPPFGAVHPHLAHLLSGRVVVGHNVDRFDLGFLREECRRAGGDAAVPVGLATIDTLGIAQRHLSLYGHATLASCCAHFGLSWTEHHNALGDAEVTASLFCAMREALGDEVLGVDDALRRARWSSWPGGRSDRSAVGKCRTAP